MARTQARHTHTHIASNKDGRQINCCHGTIERKARAKESALFQQCYWRTTGADAEMQTTNSTLPTRVTICSRFVLTFCCLHLFVGKGIFHAALKRIGKSKFENFLHTNVAAKVVLAVGPIGVMRPNCRLCQCASGLLLVVVVVGGTAKWSIQLGSHRRNDVCRQSKESHKVVSRAAVLSTENSIAAKLED